MVCHSGGAQCLGDEAGQAIRIGVQARVQLFVGQLQGSQTGGHRHRVTGQRARLVDGTRRRQRGHDVGAATEGSCGQTTGDHLAEGHQVTRYPIDAKPTLVGGTEAGHDLVEDEQGAVGMRDFLERRVEAFFRGHGAHVARCGLGDNAGDLSRVRGEGLADGVEIVIGNDDGIRGRGAGHARGIRERESGHAGASRRQQRINVAVVAALKLQDLGAAGETAGQAHGGHGGLGTGVDQAYLLHGGALNNVLRQQRLALGGCAEGEAVGSRLLHCLHDGRVGIAVDHRAIGADQVDVLIAVDIPEARALTARDNAGLAAHGSEGADRGIHATRGDLRGALEPLGGLGRILLV